MSNGPGDFPPPSDDPHRMEQPPEMIDGLRLFERPQDGDLGRIVYQGKERPTLAPPRSVAHEYWVIEKAGAREWRLVHAVATFDREDGYQRHVEELVDTYSNNMAALDDLERHVGRLVGGTVMEHHRDGSIRFAPDFSKEDAGYVETADREFDPNHDRCATCAHYIQGHGCHFVQGEIFPDAYCERFYANYAAFARDDGDEATVSYEFLGGGFAWDQATVEDFVEQIEENLEGAVADLENAGNEGY